MAARNAFSRHRLVSHCRGALLALCVAVAAPAAQAAANPSDWWVYVANDYPDEINELLARGADPNVRYRNGQPALMRAVVDGAWKVFDALAANPRTDVNAENPAGETPLMYLAIAGQVDRARSLMARGAQVNRLGWTPLHYAASKGQLAMARLLLDNKAMVNAPAPNGETPLMMAALSGNRAMVDLLLKAGGRRHHARHQGPGRVRLGDHGQVRQAGRGIEDPDRPAGGRQTGPPRQHAARTRGAGAGSRGRRRRGRRDARCHGRNARRAGAGVLASPRRAGRQPEVRAQRRRRVGRAVEQLRPACGALSACGPASLQTRPMAGFFLAVRPARGEGARIDGLPRMAPRDRLKPCRVGFFASFVRGFPL